MEIQRILHRVILGDTGGADRLIHALFSCRKSTGPRSGNAGRKISRGYTASVNTDLINRLHSARLTRGEVHALADHLPGSDADLHGVLDSLVTAADEAGVTALLLALAAGGRTIEARMLPQVLPLMKGIPEMSVVALQAQGEVVRVLLEAVASGVMGLERQAVLLLIAGWICLNREPTCGFPPDLIPKARLLAREARETPLTLLPLFALARIAKNDVLQTVLEDLTTPPPSAVIDATIHFVTGKPNAGPLDFLPERMDRIIDASAPLRRAVAKIGRNDLCPCGSGKKYKRCCFEKDQERLLHPSEVAGVTAEELDKAPEPFMTEEKLGAMRAPKLARLRIEMLPPMLQRSLIERLSMFRQSAAMLAAWEKVGWHADFGDAWDYCVYDAVRAGERDTVQGLVALPGVPKDSVPFAARLMLERDNPEKFLELMEAAAAQSLANPRDPAYIDLAFALLDGHLPGLGTLVARGAATVAMPLDAETLFDSIESVRDRLDLPPGDPGAWILDDLFDLPEELDEESQEELAEARREVDSASAEAHRLRTQLAEARAQLERRERMAARSKPAANSPAVAANADVSVLQLRERVDELKTALRERHDERNALRRELNASLEETARLREAKEEAGPPDGAPAEPDREEDALLGEEVTSLQPLRVPAFPQRFSKTLAALPRHVARSALKLIGQLAAGEPAAFAGMRRLRVRHEICRVRLAADYRLLFTPHADRLEVLDLIIRKDFEKWLKTLG